MGELCFNKGEKLILKAQGTMQLRSKWQIGHLFLTNRRLAFIHASKITFESSLDKIIRIRTKKRKWLLGIKMKQLSVEFNYGSDRKPVYISVAKPDIWIVAFIQSLTVMLAERCGYNGAESESPDNS